DPFFPKAGNGGYDVSRYVLGLRYAPGAHRLVASERITAAASEGLRRFDLDFRGPRVTRLAVDGRLADFRRSGQELVITPRNPISQGSDFVVRVHYRGSVGPITDPDGSLDGWIRTGDGALAADEPQGAPT